MVLQYLREQSIITPVLYAYLNRVWVAGVDAIDNGRLQPIFGLCTFSTMISGFVPADHELGDMDKAFFEALTFALGHLERIEKKFAYTQSCKVEVARVMQEMDACLVFDRAMPWIDAFFELDGEHHPAEFVIMPSGPHWKLRGIPPSFQKQMDVRRPMPKTWAGLSREALREKSGIGGAVFCHKGRFISIWETKEDAIHALKKVLELS